MKVIVDGLKVIIENNGHYENYTLPENDKTGLENLVLRLLKTISEYGNVVSLDAGMQPGNVPVIGADGFINPELVNFLDAGKHKHLVVNGGTA